jgi:hypothetical protein
MRASVRDRSLNFMSAVKVRVEITCTWRAKGDLHTNSLSEDPENPCERAR